MLLFFDAVRDNDGVDTAADGSSVADNDDNVADDVNGNADDCDGNDFVAKDVNAVVVGLVFVVVFVVDDNGDNETGVSVIDDVLSDVIDSNVANADDDVSASADDDGVVVVV